MYRVQIVVSSGFVKLVLYTGFQVGVAVEAAVAELADQEYWEHEKCCESFHSANIVV